MTQIGLSSFAFIYPLEGERIQPGSTYTITWASTQEIPNPSFQLCETTTLCGTGVTPDVWANEDGTWSSSIGIPDLPDGSQSSEFSLRITDPMGNHYQSSPGFSIGAVEEIAPQQPSNEGSAQNEHWEPASEWNTPTSPWEEVAASPTAVIPAPSPPVAIQIDSSVQLPSPTSTASVTPLFVESTIVPTQSMAPTTLSTALPTPELAPAALVPSGRGDAHVALPVTIAVIGIVMTLATILCCWIGQRRRQRSRKLSYFDERLYIGTPMEREVEQSSFDQVWSGRAVGHDENLAGIGLTLRKSIRSMRRALRRGGRSVVDAPVPRTQPPPTKDEKQVTPFDSPCSSFDFPSRTGTPSSMCSTPTFPIEAVIMTAKRQPIPQIPSDVGSVLSEPSYLSSPTFSHDHVIQDRRDLGRRGVQYFHPMPVAPWPVLSARS